MSTSSITGKLTRVATERDSVRELAIRLVLSFVVVSALALYAYWLFDRPAVGIDDANIFFVYAKNLSQGHGLVFNVGGERVEGFTSLVWVLVISFLYTMTTDFEAVLLAVNIILVTIALTMMSDSVDSAALPTRRPRTLPSVLSLTGVAMVVMSPSFIIWTTISLMDEGVWCFLVVAATVLLLKLADDPSYSPALSAVVALMLLTRPEAMLWCLICVGLAWIVLRLERNQGRQTGNPAGPAITYGVVLAALTGFRLIYFGVPLPNTYYAKVSPLLTYNIRQGLDYLVRYIESGVLVQLGLVATVVALVIAVRGALRFSEGDEKVGSTGRLQLALVAIMTATSLATPVLVGGDHFVGFRFLQPAYPLFVLTLCMVARAIDTRELARRVSPVASVTVAVIVLVLLHSGQRVSWSNAVRTLPILHEFKIAESGRVIGGLMTRVFSELDTLPSVGLVTVGGITYAYSGPVVDLMGLNSPVIGRSPGNRIGLKGHTAFNSDAFFEIAPDLVWDEAWASRCCEDINACYSANDFSWLDEMLHGLLHDNRFAAQYSYAQVGLRDDPRGLCVRGFYRHDLLERVRGEAGLVVQTVDDLWATAPEPPAGPLPRSGGPSPGP